MRWLGWFVTALLISTLFASSTAEAARRGMTAQERYELALRLMRQGFHQRALEEFNRVRNYHRDDPVSVLAQLAIADLHYKKGDFEQARFAYEKFATYNPRHEHLDYVTWRIGLCIWKRAPKLAGRDQGPTRGAVNMWTGFENNYPESEFVEDVLKFRVRGRDRLAAKEMFIANYYENKRAWPAVEQRARTLLKRFPESKHVPSGLFLLAESLHQMGEVGEAVGVRDILAKDHADHRAFAHVQRVLAKPPGEPPEEPPFVKPYRMPGGGGPQQGGAPQ